MGWKKSNIIATDLVSIIVPVYNSEQYLHRCLESIINQNYKNIEILLIDDGSTDNSGRICDEYAHNDHRIKIIHTKNNGPASARNIGIDNSKGEFIFFLDSDDSIENNAISLLMENYNQYRADMTIGDFEIEGRRVGLRREKSLFPSNKILAKQDVVDYVRNYLKKPTGYSLFIFNWGKLFKSSIIKDNNIRFDTSLSVFEDIAFNFEYLRFINSVSYIKNKIYTYGIYNTITSAGMKIYDNPVGYKIALESIKRFLKSKDIDLSIVEREIGNACIFFTIRTMVRFFVLNGDIDFKKVYKLISDMTNDSDIRQNLKLYTPSRGDSRVLPILIKLKLIWPIILVCKYHARRIK